jgi:hypothetical protein
MDAAPCQMMSQISFVSRLATAGRAPFGIRLKMLELTAELLMRPSCDEFTVAVAEAIYEIMTDVVAAAVADNG